MHTPWKVPVAGKDCDTMDTSFLYRLGHRRDEWPGIANAGGTSVADQTESQCLKVLKQAAAGKVRSCRRRTWSKRSFDPLGRLKAESSCLPSKEACRQCQTRVRRVRTAS